MNFETMELDELKEYAKSLGITFGKIGKEKLIEKIKEYEKNESTISSVIEDEDLDDRIEEENNEIKEDDNLDKNKARQPGSAIKTLLVYGPAFDKRDSATGQAMYTNNTIVEDNGPLQRKGSKPVKNSGSKYKGNITILEAIKGSSNVVAYKLYKELYNDKKSYALNKYFYFFVKDY